MNHTSLLSLTACLLAGLTAGAQQQKAPKEPLAIYGGLLTIAEDQAAGRTDDSLRVSFTLDAGRLEMPSVRSLTLTPLVAGEDTIRLTPILLNGRNRHQVYRRERSLGLGSDADYYAVLKASGGAEKTVVYTQTLPFEPWMKDARLVMEENLCGCGGYSEEVTLEPLFALRGEDRVPAPVADTPFEAAYAYLQPPSEAVKNRTELKDLYLHFPVNRITIDSGYMQNPDELAAARELVERIQADKNLSIREIVIRGYASPEGSVAANRRLSEGRAAALKNYLSSRLGDRSLAFHSQGGGEDWEGVTEALRAHPVAGAEELLAALEASDRSDASEQALRRIGGGAPYREMVEKIYPKVRRVACTVRYTARAFTPEESRQIIRRHPEQLSLNEMWQVAESYPERSEAFKETIRVAARTFPDNEIALVNAANVELAEGNCEGAAGYLGRIRRAAGDDGSRVRSTGTRTTLAGVTTENGIASENSVAPENVAAYENALGLLAVCRGDKRLAADHFRKAAQAGSESARKNLAQLANESTNAHIDTNTRREADNQ